MLSMCIAACGCVHHATSQLLIYTTTLHTYSIYYVRKDTGIHMQVLQD